MKQTLAITRKELSSYFGSPMALIFVGVFLAATLFSFFWIDTFFARGLADVRPLFRWMPVLMIFLVAALTMRQWSEEAQTGTLEILLTLPVRPSSLVLGKFLAVLALVALSLGLTFFLPLTVALLGNLDWGPVIGGYLATLLLASAYAAIGLFLSSRTNNQIVALILTVLVGGIFYIIGTNGITELIGNPLGDLFRQLATGSRFENIERGVVDLRDLVYYLSLTVLFLNLNILSLDSKRWSMGTHTEGYQRNAVLATTLIGLNLLALNIWLQPLSSIRLDLTQQKEFSLSTTTQDLVSNVQEPLLIRGYFSEKSHPLLLPLVPRIRDTLREYEIAGDGKVTVEILDPLTDPDIEAEANQSYGIRPTPFQVTGRHEAGVVNAYFHILIRYGDQNEVLDFQDLIEVEPTRDGLPEVRLRNPEYDLTRSIKKVVFGFQSIDAVLASLPEPAKLTLFVTPAMLPEPFLEIPNTVRKVAEDIEAEGDGKFTLDIIDPDAPDSPLNRQAIFDTYGLQPIAVSLFSPDSYYLHMVLQIGNEGQLIYPTLEMSEADIKTAIESGLKRASPGFLKTVGVWTPPNTPTPNALGQPQQPLSSWRNVADQLRLDYEVRTVTLSEGHVAPDIDVLLVIAPKQMTDRDRYAVDQYLMRGGSVIIAGGNYLVGADQFSGQFTLEPVEAGLQEMLAHYGVEVENSVVMDTQNEPLPVPSGNFGFQVIDYPFFVDIRRDQMDTSSPIISGLPAITLNWASPLRVNEEKNAARDVTVLLNSTVESWLRTDTNIQPDLNLYPELGFPVGAEQQSHSLAVAIQGKFDSFFTGQPSPLEVDETAEGDQENTDVPFVASEEGEATTAPTTIGTLETSPSTARLVVIGSADFLNDAVFELTFGNSLNSYLNQLQFIQNAVDWSVEDLDLLTIRGRGAHVRLLDPLDEGASTFWESLNYILALAALVVIGVIWNVRRQNEQPIIQFDEMPETKQLASASDAE